MLHNSLQPMSKNTLLWLVLLFAAFAFGLAFCSTPGPAQVQDLPQVTFIGTEYAFEGPESIPGGWTRVVLDNQGELTHDLMLLKVAEGKTSADVLAALESEGPPGWADFFGTLIAEPGQRASYVVELEPGNYVMLSIGSAQEGPPDAFQGMIKNLTVSEATQEAHSQDLPRADANIDLVDFSFAIDGEIKSGKQTFRVINSGKELHSLDIYRLEEGYSIADFQDMLMKLMSVLPISS